MGWNPGDAKRLRDDVIDKMRICQCGNPEETWALVLHMLERGEDHDAHGSYYDPHTADGFSASGAWVELVAKVMDGWELLEHGTGIGYSWLTDKGELLLRFLREFGVDPDKWPEWAQLFAYGTADGGMRDPCDDLA